MLARRSILSLRNEDDDVYVGHILQSHVHISKLVPNRTHDASNLGLKGCGAGSGDRRPRIAVRRQANTLYGAPRHRLELDWPPGGGCRGLGCPGHPLRFIYWRRVDMCQPAWSTKRMAWAAGAMAAAISARCKFIASVLQAGKIRAAPLPSFGQTAPKM